ncbi:MAG: CPBP family intramembrane metalloprotease [Candidatus Sumerlaeaceae bacterium]|nr:CPBP family intramembrane metalloprotease [Candidatus Sumerlaeaceae bacterium]
METTTTCPREATGLAGTPPVALIVGEMAALSAGFLLCRSLLCPRAGNVIVDLCLVVGFAAWAGWIGLVSPALFPCGVANFRATGPARTLFIRTDNLAPAMWRFGLVTLFAGLALIGATALFKPDAFLHVSWRRFLTKETLYLGSAFLQWVIFFRYFFVRFHYVLDDRYGRLGVALATAVVFSAFHSPNLPLMGLAFGAGVVWAWIYYEFPNMLAVVLCHSLLGTVVHQICQLNTRCGPNYYTGRTSVEQIFPGLAQWIFSIR